MSELCTCRDVNVVDGRCTTCGKRIREAPIAPHENHARGVTETLVYIRVQDELPTTDETLLLWLNVDEFERGFLDVKSGTWLDMFQHEIEEHGVEVTHWARVRGPGK